MRKVSVRPYRDAAKPHLRFYVSIPRDGKRARKFFGNRAEAELFARELRVELEELGIRASRLTRDARAEALACLERLAPHDTTLTQAVEFYLRHAEVRRRSRPIPELLVEFEGQRLLAGRSASYARSIRYRVGLLAKSFPCTPAEVAPPDLEAWLHGLPVAAMTRSSIRRTVGTFFEWCRKRGWCESNPVESVPVPTVRHRPPSILTPDRYRELLLASEGEIRAFLVLGGLCGLRSVEISRLDWSAVRLDRGHIDLSGNVTKTATRRLVDILPAAGAWLRPLAEESGPVVGKGFDQRLKKWRRDRPWPNNALRHSFASYHLAHFENPHKTRLQTGHSDRVLFAHYREIVSREDAAAWWGSAP